MIEQARARLPGVRHAAGDLTRLIQPDNADGWGVVLGWYSLIHLAGSEFPPPSPRSPVRSHPVASSCRPDTPATSSDR
jgi:hypothetical protein